MNSVSWETFYNDTNKLKKPASAKQLISAEDNAEIKMLLAKVLIGYLAKEELHQGLKIYINSELRNDLIEKMAARPPKAEETLEAWSKQLFGEQKFGIILMGLEAYSNAFAEKAATIVRPLVAMAGLPLNGLSFLFFMGNYGFTPFGIHKDATGEDGVLFHLGPGKKECYTWDDPQYNNIAHNSKVFHNVAEMLPKGACYELVPGDAMFIPHYVYHIANTPEFSVSMVLDYINPPKDRFENELIAETADEKLEYHKEYEKPIKMDAPLSSLSEIVNLESIQKKLETALDRKIKSLKSNGGIRRKSNKININLPTTNAFSIKGKEIFPLYLDEQDSIYTILFARGHRIVKQKHPKLPTLIDKLNRREAVSLSSLSQLMEPTWDIVEIFGFIQELLSVDAIVIV